MRKAVWISKRNITSRILDGYIKMKKCPINNISENNHFIRHFIRKQDKIEIMNMSLISYKLFNF